MSYQVQVDLQPERTSGRVTFTLVDETGAAVPSASMSGLTLTLFDKESRQIINSRQNQNVLNQNNVAMHPTSGLVTWTVLPADMQCSSSKDLVTHVAQFVAKWNSGAKERALEILMPIRNLVYNPAV